MALSLDLHLVSAQYPPPEDVDSQAALRLLGETIHPLNSIPIIFIADINGLAVGGGNEFAVNMDMRFAGPDARSGIPEVAGGVVHGGGLHRLAQLIGPARALEWNLSARAIDSKEASRIGWVNSAFESRELLREYMDDFAERVPKLPRGGIEATKKGIQETLAGVGGMEKRYEEARSVGTYSGGTGIYYCTGDTTFRTTVITRFSVTLAAVVIKTAGVLLDETRTISLVGRQIRVLRIEPAKTLSSDIECSLFTVSLDNNPTYNALSYLWGAPDITKPLTVNGVEIQVTVNLHAALRRIRKKKKRVVFWIDAVCINQQDLQERSSQVSFMGEIYSNAELVLAWLGEEDEDTRPAFELMKIWTKDLDESVQNARNLTTTYHNEHRETLQLYANKLYERAVNDPTYMQKLFDDERFPSIRAVFDKPYWKRVWVQQELFLAPLAILLCGDQQISLNTLFTFVRTRTSIFYNFLDQGQLDTIPPLQRDLGVPVIAQLIVAPRGNIQDLLHTTRSCKSSDPRDKLYGMLGLHIEQGICIKIDYQKSVERVYAELVHVLAASTGYLFVDGSNGIGVFRMEAVPEALPSWVPDLTEDSGSIAKVLGVGEGWTGAVGNKRAEIHDSGSLAILKASGLLLDRTSTTTAITGGYNFDTKSFDSMWNVALYRTLLLLGERTALEDENNARLAFGFMACVVNRSRSGPHPKFLAFCERFGLLHLLKEDSPHLGIRYLEATGEVDYLSERLERRSDAERLISPTERELLSGFWGSEDITLSTPELESNILNADFLMISFEERAWIWMHHHSIFLTSTGYVGLGPFGICEGDQICILLGAKLPLVIRSAGDTYQVVGPCFIYGMMDGEMMEKLDKGELALQELTFK
ncbi:uncharacterized protein BDZ99DRAFT_480825 [Mytilinidion resinicola]|uniref:Heterokaryon incompatibility domain-containing protein n=1 Tax=Mytilinidion resinicola TaxID=574789 RepID=A0A6A6Y7L1_9PEZI|nr:uncharacterized protein BDZ99DRAFT_480825 [Mytilinidion resinicola]KAF2804802.1 hypothetical protein BDZ99DRAFT_480825 [Mytilinidion resinicola]